MCRVSSIMLLIIKGSRIIVGKFFVVQEHTCVFACMVGDNKAEAAVRAKIAWNRYEPAGNPRLIEYFFSTHDMGACRKQDNALFIHCAASSAMLTTASIAAVTSFGVVKKPGEKRMLPCGNVPAVVCARGAQCSPTRHSMP